MSENLQSAQNEFLEAFRAFESADQQLVIAMSRGDRDAVGRLKPVWERAIERYRRAQAEWERCLEAPGP